MASDILRACIYEADPICASSDYMFRFLRYPLAIDLICEYIAFAHRNFKYCHIWPLTLESPAVQTTVKSTAD